MMLEHGSLKALEEALSVLEQGLSRMPDFKEGNGVKSCNI